MNAKFVHEGDAIDYVPSADVNSGDVVVQQDLVGIAKLDIKTGELGSLHVKGVFDLPKEVGGGKAIPAGKKVYWKAAINKVVKGAGGAEYLGKSVADAADDDEAVRVRLDQ